MRALSSRSDSHDAEVELGPGKFRLIEGLAVDGIVNEVSLGAQEGIPFADLLEVEGADEDERIDVRPVDLIQIGQPHFLEMQADHQALMGQFMPGIPHGIAQAPFAEHDVGEGQELAAPGVILDLVTGMLFEEEPVPRVGLTVRDERAEKAEVVSGKQDRLPLGGGGGSWLVHPSRRNPREGVPDCVGGRQTNSSGTNLHKLAGGDGNRVHGV